MCLQRADLYLLWSAEGEDLSGHWNEKNATAHVLRAAARLLRAAGDAVVAGGPGFRETAQQALEVGMRAVCRQGIAPRWLHLFVAAFFKLPPPQTRINGTDALLSDWIWEPVWAVVLHPDSNRDTHVDPTLRRLIAEIYRESRPGPASPDDITADITAASHSSWKDSRAKSFNLNNVVGDPASVLE
jgi:hypothetical protein